MGNVATPTHAPGLSGAPVVQISIFRSLCTETPRQKREAAKREDGRVPTHGLLGCWFRPRKPWSHAFISQLLTTWHSQLIGKNFRRCFLDALARANSHESLSSTFARCPPCSPVFTKTKTAFEIRCSHVMLSGHPSF